MEKPNLTYIKQLSDGDISFEQSILQVLKKEFPKEKLEFEKSIKVEDYAKSAELVHKIKHKFGILNLKEGYQLASSFEKDLKNKELKLYKEFLEILNRIDVYLSNY